MREIKFRVFNKNKLSWRIIKIESANDFFEDSWSNENYINLCQYTGLKDKNGKDIYENDIIKFGNKLNNFLPLFGVHEIIFLNGSFIADKTPLFDCFEWQEIEVIGNIYESPELLNK